MIVSHPSYDVECHQNDWWVGAAPSDASIDSSVLVNGQVRSYSKWASLSSVRCLISRKIGAVTRVGGTMEFGLKSIVAASDYIDNFNYWGWGSPPYYLRRQISQARGRVFWPGLERGCLSSLGGSKDWASDHLFGFDCGIKLRKSTSCQLTNSLCSTSLYDFTAKIGDSMGAYLSLAISAWTRNYCWLAIAFMVMAMANLDFPGFYWVKKGWQSAVPKVVLQLKLKRGIFTLSYGLENLPLS